MGKLGAALDFACALLLMAYSASLAFKFSMPDPLVLLYVAGARYTMEKAGEGWQDARKATP